MKKKLFLLILSINLFALSLQEEYLLFNLFSKLFNKQLIKVYSKEIKKFKVHNLVLVTNCQNADIVIGIDKNCSKPQFVLDYYKYKNNKFVIGAFYWRKGRPQIRLRKKLLLKYHLNITTDMKDFLE